MHALFLKHLSCNDRIINENDTRLRAIIYSTQLWNHKPYQCRISSCLGSERIFIQRVSWALATWKKIFSEFDKNNIISQTMEDSFNHIFKLCFTMVFSYFKLSFRPFKPNIDQPTEWKVQNNMPRFLNAAYKWNKCHEQEIDKCFLKNYIRKMSEIIFYII